MARKGDSYDNGDSYDYNEPYDGSTEREVAFKLLAAHALVHEGFFEALHDDPAKAAAELHIQLTEEDVEYIRGIDWETISGPAPDIRRALHLWLVTNSW